MYDVRDQLRTIQQGGSTIGAFLYDYQGLRIRKQTQAGTARYVYDDQSVLVQTDDLGNTISKYDYGPDRLLSLSNAIEGPQFYLFDSLGSVVNLTRPGGAIQTRIQYDAWGNVRNEVGSSANVFGFTGHEMDTESGMIYMKARFYDPELGQFLSEEPFEGFADTPPSLHKYLYAFGNPTVFIDPDGQLVCGGLCIIGAGILVAAVSDYLLSDRTERVREQIQPESFGGELASSAIAFSQSTANAATLGFFDATQQGGVSGQIQYARDIVGETDIRAAAREFTSENGDPILGTLHAVKGTAQATGIVLGAVTGIRLKVPTKPTHVAEDIADSASAQGTTRQRQTPTETGRVVESNRTAGTEVVLDDSIGAAKTRTATQLTPSAADRARQIHQAVPEATQRRTTIAVTETAEGVRVISSSEKRLRRSQRRQLQENEIEAVGEGHAEVTGVTAAKEKKLTPTGTAASRPICENCEEFLKEEEIVPLSPLKRLN